MEDTASSCDSDMDMMEDIMLFPMSDIEDESSNDADVSASEPESASESGPDNDVGDENSNNPESKLPLRLRRRSRAEALGLNWLNNLQLNTNNKSKPVGISRPKLSLSAPSSEVAGSPKNHWFKALRKARSMEDPWEKFHLEDLKTERAIRHRYTALKKCWSEDEVYVKMDEKPFNKGAMRECFRLKKLSTFTHSMDWKHTANYVAKSYMQEVDRDVYFEDVKLQMDAKLWAEEYDRHNPPKKIDIVQMYIVEMIDRPGKPLYHLEHFIEGDYIKYNSNSGFVEESLRLTPQAFSHFTFERSGHQLIIVDIQGVGNLWTDPQIHSKDGDEYGDGNLGPKGMALFFHSHVCNSICESLELTKFDLSTGEEESHERYLSLQKSAATRCRSTEIQACVSASPKEVFNISNFLSWNRKRTTSNQSNQSTLSGGSGSAMFYLDEDDENKENEGEEEHEDMSPATPPSTPSSSKDRMDDEPFSPLSSGSGDGTSSGEGNHKPEFSNLKACRQSRVRFVSESEDSASTMTEEEDRRMFHEQLKRLSRPSSVSCEMNLMQDRARLGDSVLGQIHHEMARYYEIGRFSQVDNEIDWGSAMFHEENAADLGVMEAILTMANICLGLPHDVLVDCTVQQAKENTNRGVEYMLQAAHAGSRAAMIYMAQAYETGAGLGTDRTQDWKDAIRWYVAAVDRTNNDESGEFDAVMDNPVYQLQAKMAELHLAGNYGLQKDPSTAGDLYNEAAEGAMAAMKGRLANKYYMLAEEAYGEVEE